MRCAERRRRAISVASSAGSPRSQPSERTTITDPRPRRRPCTRLSVEIASPMRVPPDQSTTAADARSSARSGSRHAELVRDARQPRAEHERLDAAVRRDRRVQVLQQHPRVRRHRARHVADEHELAAAPARARASGGRAARRRGAATARTVACRSGRTPRRRVAPRAPRLAHRHVLGEAHDDPPRLRPLEVGVLGEVLVVQQLDLAVRGRAGSPASPTLFGCAPSGGGAATRGSDELGAGRHARAVAGRRGADASPKTAANAPSKTGWSVRFEHSTARSAR